MKILLLISRLVVAIAVFLISSAVVIFAGALAIDLILLPFRLARRAAVNRPRREPPPRSNEYNHETGYYAAR